MCRRQWKEQQQQRLRLLSILVLLLPFFVWNDYWKGRKDYSIFIHNIQQTEAATTNPTNVWISHKKDPPFCHTRRNNKQQYDISLIFNDLARGGGGGLDDNDNEDDDDNEDDKAELDAYVERLIADANKEQDEVEESIIIEDELNLTERITEKNQQQEDESNEMNENLEEEEEEDGNELYDNPKDKEVEDDEDDEEEERSGENPEEEGGKQKVTETTSVTEKKVEQKNKAGGKKIGKNKKGTLAEKGLISNKDEGRSSPLATKTPNLSEISSSKPPPPLPPPPPPPKPNALYRFLLSRGAGRLGHGTAMIFILISEWTNAFVPTFPWLTLWLLKKLRIYDAKLAQERRRQYAMRDAIYSKTRRRVNDQYSGFVSSKHATTSGSQKASKKQLKSLDDAAVTKLRSVGNILEAKYHHLSIVFMKKYGLGKYPKTEQYFSEIDTIPVKGDQKIFDTSDLNEEEEDLNQNLDNEDGDWVVEALMGEDDNHQKKTPSQMSVDLELSFGKTSSSSPSVSATSRSAVLEAAAASSSAKNEHSAVVSKKKLSFSKKQRRSDRDGGGGVMGRIRAIGTESGLSSRLLGAYPGDAVPIEEAGNANGVIALARRYGYGDWSDDDDDNDDDFDDENMLTHRRRKTRRRKKKRTDNSVSMFMDSFKEEEDEIGLHLSKTSRRLRTKRKRSPPVMGGSGEIIKNSRSRIHSRQESNGEEMWGSDSRTFREKLKTKQDRTLVDESFSRSSRRPSVNAKVYLPMERTKEMKGAMKTTISSSIRLAVQDKDKDDDN